MKTSELDYFYGQSSVVARVKTTRVYVGETRLTLEEIRKLTDNFVDMSGMSQILKDFSLNTVFSDYLFVKFNKEFNIEDDSGHLSL